MFKRLSFLFLSLFLFILTATAQDYSNKGREFYIAFPAHIGEVNPGLQDVYMAIYITGDRNATGNIKVGSTDIPFTVLANKITKKILGDSPLADASHRTVYLNQIDGVVSGKAIKITSDVPVVVYAHIINARRSGASLVLPSSVLGKEYILTGYQGSATGTGDQLNNFAVVATKDSTTVEFTLTANSNNYQTGGKQVGSTYRVLLPKAGDIYQLQSQKDADFSGTIVKSIATSNTSSCNPIAVFSGSNYTKLGCSTPGSGDNLYQQLFPTRSWGKSFVTSPFIYRNYDIFRIYLTDASTTLTVIENGNVISSNALTYNTVGKFYEYRTNRPLVINASKPISVVQYMTTMSCKSGCDGVDNVQCHADPEMIILNPVEQTLKQMTFFSAVRSSFSQFQGSGSQGQITDVKSHYVNIIISQNHKNSLRIDGALPRGNFINITGTNYAYLQEDLTNSSININPVHNVSADTGFSAIVYGTGVYESYGYNGGTNVIDFNQYVSINNKYATVNFPATCTNTPFKLSITLPFKPTKLYWNFGGNAFLTPNNNITIDAPVPDSSFLSKDGTKTLYLYKIGTTYTINKTGILPIKIIANNPTGEEGCSGEQEINYDIQVFDPPRANFTSTTNGCVEKNIQFTNTSNTFSRDIIRYNWDFDNGSTSTISNPTTIYNLPKDYKVKYSIITDIGCLADTTITLPITYIPLAKYVVGDTVCVGQPVTFNNKAAVVDSSIVKYTWNFGDGTIRELNNNQPQMYTYANAANYKASLQVETSSGCKSEIFEDNVKINGLPSVQIKTDKDIACLPNAYVNFNITSPSNSNTDTTGIKYNWDFSNGNTSNFVDPTTQFTSASNPVIKLKTTNSSSCTDTASYNAIKVIAPAKISVWASSDSVCLKNRIDFKAQEDSSNIYPVLVWEWNLGLQYAMGAYYNNYTHTFLTTNYNKLRLVGKDINGCLTDTVYKTIKIINNPVANFTVNSALCDNNEVIFKNTSTDVAKNITHWRWDFGDGTTQTFNLPPTTIKHTYTKGNYNVNLLVQNESGCVSDSFIKTIEVYPLPKVDFVLPEVCLNDNLSIFQNTSTYSKSGALLYNWNLGDEVNSTSINPNQSTSVNASHKYKAVGNYKVQLIAKTPENCYDSITKVFTVNGAFPKADFEVLNKNNLCINNAVKIKNASTVDFGNITKVVIQWDKNDASTIMVDDTPSVNKIYQYLYKGLATNKTIVFSAYSGQSCLNSFEQVITLRPIPKIVFNNIPDVCSNGLKVKITQATETLGLLGAFTYAGLPVSLPDSINPNAVMAGSYAIKATYTESTYGCIDSAFNQVNILPAPVADFTVNKLFNCEKNEVKITNNSFTNNGFLTEWKWNFGDATPSVTLTNATPPAKVYASYGTYTAALTVKASNGCNSAPIQKIVNVYPLPKPSFTTPIVCLPNEAIFTSTSTIVDTTEGWFTYNWNFNDANNASGSILQNGSHNFSQKGTYNVQLKVVSKYGCTDSTTQLFNTIYSQPKAKFSTPKDSICVNDALLFTDESDGKEEAIDKWNWTFGNTYKSYQQNPQFIYTDSGYFNTSLVVKNKLGCYSDTASKGIYVFPYPVLKIADKPLQLLEGNFLTINPIKVWGTNLLYNWSTASNTPTITVNPTDSKWYSLQLSAIAGCTVYDSVWVNVLKTPIIPNAFSPNGDGINDTWLIKYLDTYPGASVQIFDRYGKLVFISIGYNKPFDGNYNGQALPVGTYYYIIEPKNGRGVMSGSITILR